MPRRFLALLALLALAPAVFGCSSTDDSDPPADGDPAENSDTDNMLPDGDDDTDKSSPDGDVGTDGEEQELEPDSPELPELTWVPIAAGTFQMGCSPEDTLCEESEKPTHEVGVSAFEMTATEISFRQYRTLHPSSPVGNEDCPDCPARMLDWYEARAFCEEIGGRLPSEAEWEYGARGGSGSRFSCGQEESCLDGIAWYWANSEQEVQPVGQKTPNPFGLYDMIGNVEEWVEDDWHDNYDGAPATGEPWTGGGSSSCLLRGGSVQDIGAFKLRVSSRHASKPYYDFSANGFRCAR